MKFMCKSFCRKGSGNRLFTKSGFPDISPRLLFLANADSANAAPALVQRDGGAFALGNAQLMAVDAAGWMDIAWPGQFPHPNGYNQVVEAADIEVMLANFNAVRAEDGQNWAGIPLYLGHPELNGTADAAPSYGWFKDARISANGVLQYKLDPAAEGNSLIADKKFKFISNLKHPYGCHVFFNGKGRLQKIMNVEFGYLDAF